MTRFCTPAVSILAVALLAAFNPTGADAQTLNTFGVLGGSTVTNTGGTIINGNVGVSPGGAITGLGTTPSPGTVNGTLHSNDQVAIDAQVELVNRYNDLGTRPVTQDLTGQDLGGLTLVGGVYSFATSAQLTTLAGPLTLDAQGNPNAVFIFQIGTTLTTDSASSINLIGGAQGANVFFVVGSSATLGTTSAFTGQILALTSITLTTGADIQCGAAWARNGAVTLDTNDITVCALVAATFGDVLGPDATANQEALAAALDAFVLAGGVLPPALQALLDTLTPAELAAAFDQLSGEASTGAAPTAMQSMDSFLSLLNPFPDEDDGHDQDTVKALGYAPEEAQASAAVTAAATLDNRSVRAVRRNGWNIWAGIYGAYNTTDGDPQVGSHARSGSAVGIAGGFDTRIAPDMTVGFAFGGGGTHYNLENNLGGGRSDTLQAAIYGRKSFGSTYVAASAAYAWHGVHTDRMVSIPAAIPPVLEHLLASYSGHDVAGDVEIGYRRNEWMTPYAALRAQAFFTPAYGETAAPGSTSVFALNYDAHTTVSIRSELGVRLHRSVKLEDGAVLALRGRIAWAHEFGSGPSSVAQFQAVPGAPFTVDGAAPGHDALLLTAGAEVRLRNGFAIGGSFDSAFALGSQSYVGTGRISYTW